MAKEILELKRANLQLKAENNELIKQVETSKCDNNKHVEEINEMKKESSNLKEEIKSCKLENKDLKFNANKADKEIVEAKKSLQKMENIEKDNKRISDENLILKVNNQNENLWKIRLKT